MKYEKRMLVYIKKNNNNNNIAQKYSNFSDK